MKKNIVLFILIVTILFSPSTILAIEFSDIEEDYWAIEHIEKLTAAGILNGYEDGTFKPEKEVSFLEVLSIIKGIIKPKSQEIKRANSIYGKTADKYKISPWARDAFTLALYKNIIYESELMKAQEQGLITDVPSGRQFPPREFIAVLFGRMLEVAPDFDHNQLKYKDLKDIGKIEASDLEVSDYLSALVNAEIFEAEGSEGKFEPKRPFRRSEMAKITDLSYEYMIKHNMIIEEECSGRCPTD